MPCPIRRRKLDSARRIAFAEAASATGWKAERDAYLRRLKPFEMHSRKREICPSPSPTHYFTFTLLTSNSSVKFFSPRRNTNLTRMLPSPFHSQYTLSAPSTSVKYL